MSDVDESAGLSDGDEVLIAALAEGLTHAAAGELAGVSAKTVQRRMSNPEFAGAVGDGRRQRVRDVVGLLVGASQRAVQVLVEVLERGDPADQLRAARMVLEYSGRYHREQVVDDDLARRMLVLEELASANASEEGPSVGREPVRGER
jgi:hypothetical protein